MKERILEEIKKALEKANISLDGDIIIEVPKDRNNGDFATNVAMQLSKSLRKNPREIATTILDNLDHSLFSKVELAGPGFINFFVSKEYLLDLIPQILEKKEQYGSSSLGNGETINLEYVSANPTGILHLGHARGAAYGDSLARILSFAGYDVTREYYINDGGNQMNNLGISIKTRYLNLCGIEEELPENGYHGQEIITIAEELYNEHGDSLKEESIAFFQERGLHILLEQIKKDLEDFHVTYDVWTSEKSLYDQGLVDDVLNRLKESGKVYQQENALYLKTSEKGDEKDRVLVKSDGNNTYLLPDIAYHLHKYKRGYDKLVDVFGADHHGYIARLKASISFLGYDPDQLEVKILQMVRLMKDGEELKMSKRTGNAVTIRELMNEVGTDVIRYFFVSHSLDSQIDFDLDLALKQSSENPIYYINYAHARICAILRDHSDISYREIQNFKTITSEYAYNVLEKIDQFQETVERSAKKREVHLITNYAYELASLFHSYYANETIVTDDEIYTQEHLAFIEAVRITLQNALKLIGVDAYEKM